MGDRERIAEQILLRQLSRRGLLKAGATSAGAALLAACGPTAASPSAAPPTSAPSAAPPSAAPSGSAAPSEPPAEDFSGITIRVAGTSTTAPPAEAAGKAWSARTGGQVEIEVIPFAERSLKYASFVAAQDPSFDVLYGGYTYIAQFGDRLYDDLGPYNVDTSDFIPAILPHLSYQGRLMSLPIHSEQEIFIYNKTMFEAAGADPENPPTTWAEMYELAPKLKEGKPAAFTVCAVPWLAPFAEIWWLVYFNSTPGTFLSDDRTQFLGGDENGLKTWDSIKAGFDAGFYDLAGAALPGDYDTGLVFNQALAASQINVAELWAQATSGKGVNPDFKVNIEPEEVGATINPGIDPGTSGGGNAAEGYGINRFSTQKDAALSFIKEVSGPEYQKQMILDIGLPSSRVSVLNDPEIVEKFPVGTVLAEQGNYKNSRYPAPYNWTPVITNGMSKIINNEWTPQQANDETKKAMEELIVKYLSGG